jgi:hypothetical protein
MQLSDFKAKPVQGLYNLTHYEAPNGAFIQVSPHGDCVFCHGAIFQQFRSFSLLKTWFVEKYPPKESQS